MYNPTTTRISKEPSAVLELGFQIGRFTIDTSSFLNLTSDACTSTTLLSNFNYFNVARGAKRTVSLSLKATEGFRFRNILHEFNRAVRFHCERIPIGFASVRVGDNGDSGGGNGGGCGEGDGVGGNGNGTVLEDEGLGLSSVGECGKAKKVLILMSDTGGGHPASAEAIKAAFHQEYGDGYQVLSMESS